MFKKYHRLRPLLVFFILFVSIPLVINERLCQIARLGNHILPIFEWFLFIVVIIFNLFLLIYFLNGFPVLKID